MKQRSRQGRDGNGSNLNRVEWLNLPQKPNMAKQTIVAMGMIAQLVQFLMSLTFFDFNIVMVLLHISTVVTLLCFAGCNKIDIFFQLTLYVCLTTIVISILEILYNFIMYLFKDQASALCQSEFKPINMSESIYDDDEVYDPHGHYSNGKFFALSMRFESLEQCTWQVKAFVSLEIIVDTICTITMIFVFCKLWQYYEYRQRK